MAVEVWRRLQLFFRAFSSAHLPLVHEAAFKTLELVLRHELALSPLRIALRAGHRGVRTGSGQAAEEYGIVGARRQAMVLQGLKKRFGRHA